MNICEIFIKFVHLFINPYTDTVGQFTGQVILLLNMKRLQDQGHVCKCFTITQTDGSGKVNYAKTLPDQLFRYGPVIISIHIFLSVYHGKY